MKSWLTYNLVKLASQLDGELFIRLCELAVMTFHRDKIEEAIRDAMRLEQEHDYEYNNEREEDAPSNNTNRKLH